MIRPPNPPPVARTPTALQVESWRLLWEELTLDAAALAEMHAWEAQRHGARPGLASLLGGFLRGQLSLDEFRAAVDVRGRGAWEAFGLRGMSGAAFLNRLVKYVPDTTALVAELREALLVPAGEEEGRARLRRFVTYLLELERYVGLERRQLQPARAAFFVTVWWHVQDPEAWPGFHHSARRALELEEGLYVPTGDPAADYFTFRDVFRALAAALARTGWELEYLCWWHVRREPDEPPDAEFYEPGRRRTPARVPAVSSGTPHQRPTLVREPPPGAEPEHAQRARREAAVAEHTRVQWLLATIGRRLGLRAWVAANDWRRVHEGTALGALSERQLPPLGLDPDSQRVVSLIDVVWLARGAQVAAAFEVEMTTSVYSGILRMADLATLAPNLSFPLYIVAPERRLEKVRRELARPVFRRLDLPRRCAYFSVEALTEAAESIMRWGTGAEVLERLAQRLDEGA